MGSALLAISMMGSATSSTGVSGLSSPDSTACLTPAATLRCRSWE